MKKKNEQALWKNFNFWFLENQLNLWLIFLTQWLLIIIIFNFVVRWTLAHIILKNWNLEFFQKKKYGTLKVEHFFDKKVFVFCFCARLVSRQKYNNCPRGYMIEQNISYHLNKKLTKINEKKHWASHKNLRQFTSYCHFCLFFSYFESFKSLECLKFRRDVNCSKIHQFQKKWAEKNKINAKN